MAPWIIGWLVLAAPAWAQTGMVDCQPSTAAALQTATGTDPDWGWVIEYAARTRRFDMTTPTRVARCVRADGSDYWMVQYAALRDGRPPADAIYDRNGRPASSHFIYRRSSRTAVDACRLMVVQATERLDGTTQLKIRDASGRAIRPSSTTIAPAARRRRL